MEIISVDDIDLSPLSLIYKFPGPGIGQSGLSTAAGAGKHVEGRRARLAVLSGRQNSPCLQFFQHKFHDFVFIVGKLVFVYPYNVFFSTEPCELPFGKMPGIPFDGLSGLFQRGFALQIGQDFLVAKPLHGNHAPVASHLPKPLYFFHQPLAQHFVYTKVYPFIDAFPQVVQHEVAGIVSGFFFTLPFIMARDGLSRQMKKF